MKNQPLKKLLDDYISAEEIEGAFYIDGPWGSGKTKFINDYLSNLNKNENVCYYISLNGMKNSDEIISELFSLLHPKLNAIKNSKVTKALLNIVKGIGNYFGIENGTIEEAVDVLKSFFDDTSVKVLILDDFERCRIETQELFGLLSSLIIKSGVKIILIGNDEEIRKYLQTDTLFKDRLLIAAASKDHDEYLEKVDSKSNRLLYDSIKEKCIYKTYSFIFDEEIFFNYIVAKYSKTIQTLVKTHKEPLLRILNELKCNNLRTCKAILDNYQVVSKVARKKFKNNKYIKSRMLLACAYYTVLFKNGQEMKAFSQIKYYGNEPIYPIKPVGNYVYSSSINKEAINEALAEIDRERTSVVTKTAPSYITVFYSNWFTKTDDELKEEMSNLYSKIDEVPFQYFFNTIHYFYVFNDWFTDSKYNLDEIIKKMIDRIESCDKTIEYNDNYVLFEMPPQFVEHFKELETAFKEHNKKINTELLNFSKDNLKTYVEKELSIIESTALTYRSFFERVDVDKLIDIIKNGSSEDIINLRTLFRAVYKMNNIGEFFSSDLPNLIIFYEQLKIVKDETNGVIKNKNIDLLIKDVTDYIDRMDKNYFSKIEDKTDHPE